MIKWMKPSNVGAVVKKSSIYHSTVLIQYIVLNAHQKILPLYMVYNYYHLSNQNPNEIYA